MEDKFDDDAIFHHLERVKRGNSVDTTRTKYGRREPISYSIDDPSLRASTTARVCFYTHVMCRCSVSFIGNFRNCARDASVVHFLCRQMSPMKRRPDEILLVFSRYTRRFFFFSLFFPSLFKQFDPPTELEHKFHFVTISNWKPLY